MISLAMPGSLRDELVELARGATERAGVLLAAVGQDDHGNVRLAALEFHPVPEAEYVRQSFDELVIGSGGWVPALGRAAELEAVAIWVHSHPESPFGPRLSDRDETVNTELALTFAERTGSGTYGWIIVSQRAGQFQFSGALTGALTGDLARMVTVDGDVRIDHAFGSDTPELGELHSRHVLAFGDEAPKVIGALQIAVIGAGGTGSATAEQLVRLGARDLLLIDDDELSLSNTTRVYGSYRSDVGRPKVEVLRDHLLRIAPDARIEALHGRVTELALARRLVTRDVIFGCTDDNAGRVRLSRVPYAYEALLIDCGVRVESTGGQLQGVYGRVSVLHRGVPCLLCRGRIDLARLAAEERPADEQEALAAEGYAPELGTTEPAVVTFTSAVAAAAVSELLERIVGYGIEPRPVELLHRFHERDIRTLEVASRPRCYCDAGSRLDVRGDRRGLFLGVNWAA